MQLTTEQQLFEYIKKDDIDRFTSLINEKKSCLSFAYGRFPALSVCYMYNAERIIKIYEKDLAAVNSYAASEEFPEIYKKFKSIAGRCLRLYTGTNTVISPLEIIALKDDRAELIRAYKRLSRSGRAVQNIAAIYAMRDSAQVTVSDSGIVLPRSRLTSKAMALTLCVIIIACVFALACGGALFGIYDAFGGSGSEKYPTKISSEKQLIEAVKTGGRHYILTSDITLKEWEKKDFDGVINGNGHTVTVNNATLGLFNKLSGSISDINIVYGEINVDMQSSIGLVAEEVTGKVSGLNISFSGTVKESSDTAKLYFAGVSVTNSGTVADVKVTAQMSIEGDGEGDIFFSSIVGVNNGSISSCEFASGSSVVSDTVDIGGIAVENAAGAGISSSINYATLYQEALSNQWSPNVAGVVINNAGTVSNCFNYGDITSASNATEGYVAEGKTYYPTVYAGGIVCVNNGAVNKSKSDAVINAESKIAHIYAGGVVAHNYTLTISDEMASINNCCAYGTINIISTAEEDKYSTLYGGGIAGVNYSRIIYCYSNIKIKKTETNSFAGEIIGLVIMGSRVSDNYYIDDENLQYPIGLLYDQFNDIFYWTEEGCTSVVSMEAMKLKGVYWG